MIFEPVVSAAWLADHIGLPDLAVVDVRWYLDGRSGRAAYDNGHIPGAVFVDLDRDLSSPPSPQGGRHPLPSPGAFAAAMGRCGVGDSTRVVAYDDAGGVIAARLWWMLDALGHPASVLDGGIGAWAAGELATGADDPVPAEFSAAPWPTARLIDADGVAALTASCTVILDARSADRYAHGGPVDPRPGHIPGARSAPATDNLADGRFRAPQELGEHYRGLGAADRDVVAYCGSGVTACADLLALRRAGLPDGRLFAGSWSAWGADPTRPAEQGSDRR